MKESNIAVMRKILGAVETGGQVYGQIRYNDLTLQYTNSSAEHAITIGGYQHYANEAKRLLQTILDKYPTTFRKLDSAGIESDLKKDWSNYQLSSKTCAKGKTIVNIISSADGIKCQDLLMDNQIKEYAASYTKTYGEMPDDAMMEVINIAHQGGSSAVKRILGKTSKPYSAKKIYDTLNLDPADKSSNNQVGDYTGRQKKVYEYITKYADFSSTTSTTSTNPSISSKVTVDQCIAKVIEIAKGEIGYLEKKSNSNLYDKTTNAGSNNWTKYWAEIKPSYQAQPWCACFVSWVFKQAFGQDVATKLLKHWPFVYCPTLGSLLKNNANPKVGDIVLFKYSGASEFGHTGIVIAVNGDQFTTIEGNTSGGSTIIANGGGVCKKTYYNSNLPGTKFVTPDYSLVTKLNSGTTTSSVSTNTKGSGYMFEPEVVQLGSNGASALLCQKLLRMSGCRDENNALLVLDGDFGQHSLAALKKFQTANKLEVDGVCGPNTWKKLVGI